MTRIVGWLLGLKNVIIAPHLGSATEQTRRKMAEISFESLLRGLASQPLLFDVTASVTQSRTRE